MDTAKINAAISSVMKEVRRLEKLGVNAFDKYQFTSVDDFKDHLRPLLAKNGLNVSISETSFDLQETKNSKGETKLQCKIGFEFTLRHDDGSELPPDKTTVMLPYTGAQTAGIAKSYAMKEWGKGRFLASSGDVSEEADMRRQDDFSKTVLSKKDAKPLYEALIRELRSVAAENNSDSMLAWANESREQVHQMPMDWQEEIRAEYVKTLETIKAAERLDGAK